MLAGAISSSAYGNAALVITAARLAGEFVFLSLPDGHGTGIGSLYPIGEELKGDLKFLKKDRGQPVISSLFSTKVPADDISDRQTMSAFQLSIDHIYLFAR